MATECTLEYDNGSKFSHSQQISPAYRDFRIYSFQQLSVNTPEMSNRARILMRGRRSRGRNANTLRKPCKNLLLFRYQIYLSNTPLFSVSKHLTRIHGALLWIDTVPNFRAVILRIALSTTSDMHTNSRFDNRPWTFPRLIGVGPHFNYKIHGKWPTSCSAIWSTKTCEACGT